MTAPNPAVGAQPGWRGTDPDGGTWVIPEPWASELRRIHRPIDMPGGVQHCATCRGKYGYRRPWPTDTDRAIHQISSLDDLEAVREQVQ